MLLQVLLVLIEGFVLADDTTPKDSGEVPYENPAIPVASSVGQSMSPLEYGDIPYDKASPGLPMSPLDYGDIPYDKAIPVVSSILPMSPLDYSASDAKGLSKSEDGNIPSAVVLKPQVHVDYGNVPYEKVVLKPRVDVDYGDIPYEKDIGMTTRVENDSINIPAPSAAATAPGIPELETTQTETIETTFKLRAKQYVDPMDDYKSPGTIDDSHCNPRIRKCSTCTDKVGYRVYCLDGTTTRAPTDLRLVIHLLSKICEVYWSNGDTLWARTFQNSVYSGYPGGWPVCPTTTATTATPSPTDAPSKLTGLLIAKCFVCGMYMAGIPFEDHICADSYMSHTYKKHCKYLNRDGWFVNGTGDFYMWGRWTGGCSLRYADISPVYHQRTCRNRDIPAMGASFASRRMEKLEYGLRRQKDGCLSSPTASLVPLSRGISLYSRFHVCVCSTSYCNRAERFSAVLHWYTVVFTLIRSIYEGSGRISFLR